MGPIKLSGREPNYGMTTKIINLTNRSIYVKDRMGSVAEIKPLTRGVQGQICIEVTWNGGFDQIRMLYENYERYAVVNQFCRNAAEALHAFLRNPSNSSPQMRIFMDEELLYTHSGAIYQADLDLLILFSTQIECEHPDSPLRRFERGQDPSVNLIHNCGADALIYAIEAIDNSVHPLYTNKYLYLGDQIHHVSVKHKPGSADNGFIITRNKSAEEINKGLYADRKYVREVLTFQEAAKRFGVADTIEEARHLGDLKAAADRRVVELQLQIRERDAELALSKREHELQAAERDRKTNDLKYHRECERSQEDFSFQREKWAREREKLDSDAVLLREKNERDREKALQDCARDEIRNTYEWMKILSGGMAILGTFLGLSRLKLV